MRRRLLTRPPVSPAALRSTYIVAAPRYRSLYYSPSLTVEAHLWALEDLHVGHPVSIKLTADERVCLVRGLKSLCDYGSGRTATVAHIWTSARYRLRLSRWSQCILSQGICYDRLESKSLSASGDVLQFRFHTSKRFLW